MAVRVVGGRYELVAFIGRGGMGTVWEGRDRVIERRVAVKLLPHDRRDTSGAQLFLREAKTAGGLNDPGVVTVFDLGQDPDDGTLYLVMEFLAGRDLDTVLRKDGPPEVPTAVDWAAQTAAALHAAHTAGVVHRDLKPANLMLGPDGRVKILDFGIARCMASTHTSSNVVGTLAYMPPERFRDLPGDARSDLYSLGCVLHELLTGRTPFQAGDLFATMAAHLHATPAPPGDTRPGVPAALDDLVLALLAKDPGNRPASAAEVHHRLRELRTHLREAAQESTVITGGGAPTTAATARYPGSPFDPDDRSGGQSSTPPAGSGRDRGWRPSRRALLTAGIGALAAAAVPTAIELATSSSADSPRGNKGGNKGGTPSATTSPRNAAGGIAPPVDLVVDNDTVRGVAFSPDGSTLAVAGGNTVTLWDFAARRVLFPFTGVTGAGPVRFSPDGKILLCVADEGVVLWDPVAHTHIGTLPDTKHVNAAAFAPDSSVLICGSDDGVVTVWGATPPRPGKTLSSMGTTPGRGPIVVNALSFSSAGGVAAAACADRNLRVWVLSDLGRPPQTYTGHTDEVTCLAFMPDVPVYLVTGSSDHTIKRWVLGSPDAPLATLTGHTGKVHSVAYSLDGRTIASASNDGTVRLWDGRADSERTTANAVLTGHTGPVYAVAFSPDGRTLASAGGDAVKLWTLK
ncbi:WD40 repeat domain-containing serine/threonine protein kinase [Embleya sp. NBC_00896]|uniref:WD40 repeat domain-containing serine/threonine protein kinase n=1 Tax=Embleya sp. NBC_00896 TaxID=2975961 RepID=UPI00386E5472|nr:serine/threonine protein kinase [Embleya sp. NBC_00896]